MTSDPPSLLQTQSLSLALARKGLDASLSHAASIGVPVNVSIFSSTLHQVAFAAMDGAKLTSIDIAHNKAFTAAGHRASTGSYGKKDQPGGGVYGIQHSNGGRFMTIAGGLPVLVDGECVGGVGVSGGTPAQDEVSQAID
jgi:uncharacterized protein GlcG (DUF336 family)